jgi:hypothetical protein
MTDMRATERLLGHIAEQADLIATQSPGVAEPATAIHDAVDELRRRGDTLVRRDDLWIILEYADSDEVLLESQRVELKAAFARIQHALGGPP